MEKSFLINYGGEEWGLCRRCGGDDIILIKVYRHKDHLGTGRFLRSGVHDPLVRTLRNTVV